MKSEKVYFKGLLAGIISEEPTGEISFQYDPNYLADLSLPPISVSLPKQSEPFKGDGLPSFFDGLIPEGWLLTLAAEQYKLNPIRDRFSLLLATCQDTIGAVTIGAAAIREPKHPQKWDQVELRISLKELSRKFDRCLYCYQPIDNKQEFLYHRNCSLEIFNTEIPPVLDFDNEKIKELGLQTINEKLAVPGVQKKISLSLDEETGKNGQRAFRMTVANLWARYILKPKSNPPHLPENEHLNLLMARQAGIKTANSGLLPLKNGQLAFISERFDRPQSGGKNHMEDFCQILGKRPEQKYIGSVEQVGKQLRNITYINAPEDNILRLFELVVFCYLTGNADLHLKNISVLWSPMPSLSPAYDLLCTDAWIKDDEETALSISGKKNKLNKLDFEKLYLHLGIKPKVANNVYAHMAKQIQNWQELIDASYLEEEYKEKFKELLHNRAKTLFS
ncbi:MAG: hypothetical protein RJB66_1675 [Pseudomonadota bacterium]|jgi:serine/threonine-protein kinase HipA